MSLGIVTLLIVARIVFARRPVLIACRTLLVVLGVASVADLLLGLRRHGTPVTPILALVVVAALYPVLGRVALVLRASLAELTEGLSSSARMIRLGIEGGPGRYHLSSGETSATLSVVSRLDRFHALVFGEGRASRKIRLFRTVVAKQFGGLIPILIKVRS